MVMVDEKWFFMKKQGQKYILAEGEDLPVHKVQHKSHIKKVMFLAAVRRPRRDTLHNRNFSGKIGIFPFTRRVPFPTEQQAQGCGYDGDADGGGGMV